MSRNSGLDSIFATFGAHPYLWMLAACLCCQPLLFGTDLNVTSYTLSLETVLVIGATAIFGLYVFRSVKAQPSELVIFGISAVLAYCFIAMQFTRQEDVSVLDFSASWGLITAALFVLTAAFLRNHCAGTPDDQRRINCLMIIGAGFLLTFLAFP